MANFQKPYNPNDAPLRRCPSPMKAYQAFILSPGGGEGRVNCNLLLPLPWAEGGCRPGEGVAADGARVFSVDGIVRCIIWVLRSRDALVTTRTELISHVQGFVSTIRNSAKASSMSS